MGPPLPCPKNVRPPNFGPCLLWSNGWMDQDGIWHGSRPHPSRLCVTWGPSSPPQKGVGAPSPFSTHFYCGQTAGCINMPLGMELGLSPGDFVLDGTQPSPTKRGGAPNFRPMSIAAEPLHRSRCQLVQSRLLNFRPITVMAKRLDGWHFVWRSASLQATLC